MVEKKPWYVYMIITDKQALYTGISTDVERRFAEHMAVANGVASSKGAKFFRLHKPVRICYQQRFADRSSASRHEYQLKQLSKACKLKLVAQQTGAPP